MAVGKIGAFDVAKDNWDTYVDRVDQYFIANNVKSELKVATLITVIGNSAYELMVNLCTPDKPSSKTYTELVAVMKGHLNPKPSMLAERFKFRQRIQKPGENIATYFSELKRLSKDCSFTADSLKENMRDQFVCGLVNDDIRQKLFTEDDSITIDKAYKLALSMEAAETNAALVEDGTRGRNGSSTQETATVPVHKFQQSGGGDGWRGVTGGGNERRGATGGGSERRGAIGGGNRPARRNTRVARESVQASGGGSSTTSGAGHDECRVCGGKHNSNTCKFKLYVCRICTQEGHLKRMCPKLIKNNSLHNMQENRQRSDGDGISGAYSADSDSDEVIVPINRLSIGQCKPIMISLCVQGYDLKMECDTGSAISCINYQLYQKMFSNLQIKPTKLVLRYYTGELVCPVGVIRPVVKYNNTKKILDLYIIENGNTVLLGRQWMAELNILVSNLQYNTVNNNNCETGFNFSEFSSRYCEVFADGLGRFTGGQVSIRVREGARPVFMRARPLAYALREPVERALEQLVRDDILTPVDHSDWATPIVPVVKKDGTIRICADFKLTLNKVLEVDRYPLPKVEDLLARLHGGERFSKIDLSQAYAQLELDHTRKYAVINTHKGLFMYKRLVYGLSSSPGIFQRCLEQLFADMPHVGVFLDDIIITGRDTSQHLDNLHKVFERLKSSGLKVKKEKCSFFVESLDYLGHVISKEGVHTSKDKVEAIVRTPIPRNVSELRAFIGMVMYYGKFIKNVSSILTPLYNLLRVGARYDWSEACDAAFSRVKRALSSSEVLVHYSLELPLVLTADASAAGIGAVISHITPGGERPIAYASRTLNSAERSYAQIDREALAIIYGIKKFHQYLYVKTKSMARSYVWWPNIDADIEATCRACETCAMEATAPPHAAPRSWPYLTQPWSRLHVDFLGPYQGKIFFIVIDSSSKWIEIFEMNKTNATAVIKVMRSLFARFGLPLEVVSDQGPPFTSTELKEFLALNGIKQSFSPVYHPASNGAAENAVKLCKRAIKKAIRDDVDIDTALQTYLLAYRNSIQSTTGESPAMLLQRRPLRSRLDLLRGDHARRNQVEKAQRRQMTSSGTEPLRKHAAGDAVWARNYGSQDKWVKGTIISQEGSRRYVVNSDDGRLLTRHRDQIRRRSRRSSIIYPNATPEEASEDVVEQQPPPTVATPRNSEGTGSGEVGGQEPPLVTDASPTKDSPTRNVSASHSPLINNKSPTAPTTSPMKRPTRIGKKPVRYGFEFD
ncbi:uncharacterized protein K02A2.6-like [Melitaea cinxia]|uniref:uncharacterized protein K02A2.6-like n=1 Tax=Melitaea cinxia TaxID=113334 RepID=UPI001E271F71|nr:uncharacterized protein K02A2.6-like [Melitaea cinxia]